MNADRNAERAARADVREAVRSLLTTLDRHGLRPDCYGDLERLYAEHNDGTVR